MVERSQTTPCTLMVPKCCDPVGIESNAEAGDQHRPPSTRSPLHVWRPSVAQAMSSRRLRVGGECSCTQCRKRQVPKTCAGPSSPALSTPVCSSVRSEFSPWKRGVVRSNRTTQTNISSCNPLGALYNLFSLHHFGVMKRRKFRMIGRKRSLSGHQSAAMKNDEWLTPPDADIWRSR